MLHVTPGLRKGQTTGRVLPNGNPFCRLAKRSIDLFPACHKQKSLIHVAQQRNHQIPPSQFFNGITIAMKKFQEKSMEKITLKIKTVLILLLLFTAIATTGRAETLDESALRGEAIANQDPLAVELRNQQPDDFARQGFDIGMAVAEGQTAPGPGKDKACASLPTPAEQNGCRIAVSFSVERNKNAALASVGARIAGTDQELAAARTIENDVFYSLGFDIASGIFGDPALGARGNTATGPGSLGIRDSLSAAGQRGFNASVKLHLSRRAPASQAVPPDQSAASGIGTAIDKFGAGPIAAKSNHTLPNVSKRLILTTEATNTIIPVQSGKINLYQTIQGHIYLAISFEDGTPFTLAHAEDIQIKALGFDFGGGATPELSGGGGIWGYTLRDMKPGTIFYLISVVVDAKEWRTTFQGQAIVRATYTRMPYWNAQRVDGTIWEPPK
jgi:hypothetical protein